jgi:serine protease Do
VRELVIAMLAVGSALLPISAGAENLRLSGPKRWLTVASTKDVDTAIGIARQLQGNDVKVVSSQSGYYAIVMGPFAAKSVSALKAKIPDLPEVPKDALLSNGARYIDTIWKAPVQNSPLVGYGINRPAHLSSGDVSVELSLEKVAEDKYATVVTGAEKNGQNFTFKVSEDGESLPTGSEAGFVKLDPTLSSPQLVFTRYSGGAHCCTSTWILQKPESAAGWSLIDAGKLDGGGYSIEDVDGDGALELLSIDNSFLYAFDSYAASFAPLHIFKLHSGKIEDVSEEPAMRARLKQDLAGIEYSAKLNPELWKANGYLAGWLASKMRLGQGEEAWQTVVENADKNSAFGPEECTSGQKIEDCLPENLKPLPVLKAMADFMREGGYGPLPTAAGQLTN